MLVPCWVVLSENSLQFRVVQSFSHSQSDSHALTFMQHVTVTPRALAPYSARRMVAVSVRKALWETVVPSVKRIISTIGPGLAVKSVLRVIDWLEIR